MKAKVLALPVLLLAAPLMGAEEKKAADKDLEALQGTWLVETLVGNGKDFYADGQSKVTVTFKGNKGTLDGNDLLKKEYATFTVKLDPSTTPKCLDMTITDGNQKDVVFECIYEVKGDELKICAVLGGKERPTDFTSAEGSNRVLAVAKRQKP
jgi:uncharacterized protein (TIGR03067 family)